MAPKNWTMQMCIAMYWIISNRRFEPKLPEQDISKMLNYKSLTLEKGLEQSLVIGFQNNQALIDWKYFSWNFELVARSDESTS